MNPTRTEPSTPPPNAAQPHAALHPRLAADCHMLGRLERGTLLLHRHAAVGWLILVPDTEAIDWHELDDAEHERLGRQVREVSVFASDWFGADKMNIATLGNEVPQMHIHIVARRHDDACWPKPVWGNLPEDGTAYSPEAISRLVDALVSQVKMQRIETPRG